MKSIRYAFFILLFMAPLMFGAVESWSLAIVEITCVVLLFAWVMVQTRSGQGRLVLVRPPLLFPLGIILGISVVQVIPLPPVLMSIVSPNTYNAYREAALVPGNLPWVTLSLYPHATVQEIIRLISCLCIYILTLQILRNTGDVSRAAAAILILGVVVSLTGIFQVVWWNHKVLWLREFHEGSSFGPYFNRNHFAGLMEMLIPVSVGLTISLVPSVRYSGGIKALVSDLLTGVHANKLILALVSIIIMITSLFLSLSRGGIVGLSVSMLLFGSVLLLRSSTRGRGWTVASIFLVVLFSVGWFGWNPVIERFKDMGSSEKTGEQRINNWKDSLAIVRDFPVFGTGLGTYEHVYPRYRTVPGHKKWEHAHNDYVEGAVELGVPGLIMGMYVMVAFCLVMFRILKQRRSLGPRLLGLGGLAGITAIAIHSLTDFNLHIGANALFFSFLVGFSIAASHIKTTEEGRSAILGIKEITFPSRFILRAFVALVTAVCLLVSAVPFLNACSDILFLIGNGQTNEGSDVIRARFEVFRKAAALSPLDARYPFALGNIDLTLGRRAEAVGNYARAAALNPVNGEYLQMLGVALDGAGQAVSADRFMRASVVNDPLSSWRHKNYALWLFSKGRKQEGMEEMRKAIYLDPQNTRKYVTGAVLGGLSREEVRSVIPRIPSALMYYGRYREELGEIEGAVRAYRDALSVMNEPGDARAGVYRMIASAYESRGLNEQALGAYREGIGVIPSSRELRIGIAGVYEKLKLPERAAEQYEYVLKIDPSNDYAQRRLKELAGR